MCPDMLMFLFSFFFFFLSPPRKISGIFSPLNRNLEGKFDIIPRTAKHLCVAVTGVLFLHSLQKPASNVASLQSQEGRW